MTGGPNGDPVRTLFRRALREVLVLVAVLTVLGAVAGAAAVGAPGLWAGLAGAAVTLVVAGSTAGLMLLTAGVPLSTSAALAFAAWVLKAGVLLLALLALRSNDIVDRRVFGLVVLAGVLGSMVVDFRAVARSRVPYTDRPERG